jgi:hypothetical protein
VCITVPSNLHSSPAAALRTDRRVPPRLGHLAQIKNPVQTGYLFFDAIDAEIVENTP